MKAVILAGGLGTRLAEETDRIPKPMVEIGGRPILWHIMKHYAHDGIREFIVALGYKGDVIKRYFLDYRALSGDVTVDLATGSVTPHAGASENWKVHLVDTGLETQTAGRIKRLEAWLRDGTFMVTYGDGVSNLNLRDLLAFHRQHGKMATLTAVRPPSRFGGVLFDGDRVRAFTEKPQIGEGWINGGYMVFEPAVLDLIRDDNSVLEREVMETLVERGELMAFRHDGFWQCMDTLRDKRQLESMWANGRAEWKVWT